MQAKPSIDMYRRSTASANSDWQLVRDEFMNEEDEKISQPPKHTLFIRCSKRAIDIVGALLIFILFGVFYVLIALCLRLTSNSPVIYSQQRYGRGGRPFNFYKFRSMVANADKVLEEHLKTSTEAAQQWQEFQKLDKDPRITRFGKFIRKTSLDELPQIWNVLIGDMSLIGPRPCMRSQKGLYGPYWSYYCAVRPGLTGLWQVSGRNKLNYDQRVFLDVRYVQDLSLRLDLFIAAKTVWVVATGHGSK